MGSHGIRDQVAIVGMGCTAFGEHWDKSTDDLLIESATAAAASAGVPLGDIDAFWLGTMGSGVSGLTLSRPLRLAGKPVTRLENMCATGSESLRNACYAVASGAYDCAMAIGVEKLKDSGFSGLVGSAVPGAGDDGKGDTTAPANFSLLAPAYAAKYGVDPAELKDVLTRIAWKNHQNGAKNPRAQFRKEVSRETISRSPLVAGMLGIFDCSGVSDGSAAAIVVRAADAHLYCDKPLYVKALSLVAGPASGLSDPGYDFTTFPEVAASARDAYAQAGITDPRAELALAEVHDCFTPTELVLMEDLGFAERGQGWKDVLSGRFDLDGDLPVNPDGGLKAFGHPIGASGLRMMFEAWLQLRGEAPAERALRTVAEGRSLALTHNLGGGPGECVSFVSVVGTERGGRGGRPPGLAPNVVPEVAAGRFPVEAGHVLAFARSLGADDPRAGCLVRATRRRPPFLSLGRSSTRSTRCGRGRACRGTARAATPGWSRRGPAGCTRSSTSSTTPRGTTTRCTRDEIYATKIAGYPSVFAHGMLTMGLTGQAIAGLVGAENLVRFGVRFTAQVWPGDTLTVRCAVVRVGDGDAEFSVSTVNGDGTEVVSGYAHARLAG